MGRYATLGLERSQRALARGALVPLATERVEQPGQGPFVLRRLLSATPKHLRSAGPKPNPFLPWDPDLEVERLADTHLVLLNKYPVQEGHLLLITQRWAPRRAGWTAATGTPFTRSTRTAPVCGSSTAAQRPGPASPIATCNCCPGGLSNWPAPCSPGSRPSWRGGPRLALALSAQPPPCPG